MKTFLLRYLLVTGLTALLVLLVPQAVTVGLILFILPGLALMWTPTAFLWGFIFACAWFPLRRVCSERVASMLALASLGIALWGIPVLTARLVLPQLTRHSFATVTKSRPIHPAGDIRMDDLAPASSPQASRDWPILYPPASEPLPCGELCVSLLFEPGVRSVTINSNDGLSFEQLVKGLSPLRPRAGTYRLLKHGQCKRPYQLDPRILYDAFSRTLSDKRTMTTGWEQRLVKDLCIDVEPALDRFDLLLRTARWSENAVTTPPSNSWFLTPRILGDFYGEVRDGKGQVLARRSTTAVSALSMPLRITAGDIFNEPLRFRWARQTAWEGARQYDDFWGRIIDNLAVRRMAQPVSPSSAP